MHIMSTIGSEALGGDDFDTCIYNWAERKLRNKLRAKRWWPLSVGHQRQLRELCKKAKEQLSSSTETTISFAGQELTLSRDEFND
eukprot:3290892-Amphidinium_carterae.1